MKTGKISKYGNPVFSASNPEIGLAEFHLFVIPNQGLPKFLNSKRLISEDFWSRFSKKFVSMTQRALFSYFVFWSHLSPI